MRRTPIRAKVEHPFRVIKRQFGFSKVRCPGHRKNTEAGRCYGRFGPQSNALGIRTSFVNQPVDVASMRPRFASLLGASGKLPGQEPAMPSSLSHDVDSVLP